MFSRKIGSPNVPGRRRLAIHSLVSGLFLPFLVVYLVQADHLSLVLAGAALVVGFVAAKLGRDGCAGQATRWAGTRWAGIRRPGKTGTAVGGTRLPVLGDHRDVPEPHDHIAGPEVGDLDGGHPDARDSKDATGPPPTFISAR